MVARGRPTHAFACLSFRWSRRSCLTASGDDVSDEEEAAVAVVAHAPKHASSTRSNDACEGLSIPTRTHKQIESVLT
jgi:hypothetical protein